MKLLKTSDTAARPSSESCGTRRPTNAMFVVDCGYRMTVSFVLTGAIITALSPVV